MYILIYSNNIYHWWYFFKIKKTRKISKTKNKKMINDSNFHVKFFRNEFKIVAYLKYIIVKNFRKLRFHFSSLFWYLTLIKYCKVRNFKILFNILQTNVEKFDETLNVLIIKYFILNESKNRFAKTINNLHRNHIYVDIFVKFNKDLKVSFIYIQKQIFFIIINFEKLFFDECKLFSFALIEIISFTLNSLLKENSLKKFNRVNAIFKFIQCVFAFNRWKEIFKKKKCENVFNHHNCFKFHLWLNKNWNEKYLIIHRNVERFCRKIRNNKTTIENVYYDI
jgi:hypothetical protein